MTKAVGDPGHPPSSDGSAVTADGWTAWRAATPARVALGRAGAALPTQEVLKFGWAHAMARDAIHVPLDVEALTTDLRTSGWPVALVRSAAADRMTYLRRPDLGRRLEAGSALSLEEAVGSESVDLSFVVGDGLSSMAAARHALPLLEAMKPLLPVGLRVGPVVIATQARVALGDDVGERMRARMVVVLIGERPGLSSPDSLGVYITHAPRRGVTDAQRNCVSNVRPQGLSYAEAAFRVMWLASEGLRRQMTGTLLKDESRPGLL